MKDYYSILGVEKTATQDEIKQAYRKLAKTWHPDVNPDKRSEAEEKFKAIGEAYETLGDPEKRAAFDRPPIEDPFASFFRHSRQAHRRQPKDVIGTIEIDLVEAATGGKRRVTIEHEIACEACDGTGSGTKKRISCSRCSGSGVLKMNQNSHNFVFSQNFPCPNCSGAGSTPESECQKCHGSRERTVMETLEISFPAGIATQQVQRIPKMGRNGGDLRVFYVVAKHPKFERDQNDLLCEIEIPFRLALSGGKTTTTGLMGEPVEFEIPRGCQYGSQVVARGKGIAGGSLCAKVYFMIPCLPDEISSQILALLPP